MIGLTALRLLLALPLLASPVIYLAGRISVRLGKSARPARWLAVLICLLTWVPLVLAAQSILQEGPIDRIVMGVSMRMDGISLLLAGTVLALGTLVMVFSMPYMRGDEGEEKYYALLPAMMGSMIGLGCANDLFNLWVWFEAMAVSSYLLVAFYHEEPASLEAGVKYLVQSAAGSALVLLGVALVVLDLLIVVFAVLWFYSDTLLGTA